MAQLRYWVWLTSLEGLRPLMLRRLLDRFGGPTEVYFADSEDYRELEELTERERRLLDNKDLTYAGKILEICQKKSITILTEQDALYPDRLRMIADPPPVLFVRGTLPFLDEIPTVALVGTRTCTPYGEKMALKLGREITEGGGLVVTGLALGIDGEAARGALLAGGPCVGVLGTAIDVDYPAANASLIADVAATGAVISEFPPLYPTKGENFPRRNRIISGLSDGVCVIEAPKKSGALITAELALEQGRDVFAVPGNADSPMSVGTNSMLRDGAHCVCCGAEILEEYEGLYPGHISAPRETFLPTPEPEPPEKREKSGIDKSPSIHYIDLETRVSGMNADQTALMRALWQKGEVHVDQLIAETGLSAQRTLAALTMLVIRGDVRSHPGKRYSMILK